MQSASCFNSAIANESMTRCFTGVSADGWTGDACCFVGVIADGSSSDCLCVCVCV